MEVVIGVRDPKRPLVAACHGECLRIELLTSHELDPSRC
jgi:hypothetical protein